MGTILHQYISAANIKKVFEMGLLVLPVCISLPIGGTDSFSPNILVQMANGSFFHSYKTFKGRGWKVGNGRLPIGQVSYRTPVDRPYCVV